MYVCRCVCIARWLDQFSTFFCETGRAGFIGSSHVDPWLESETGRFFDLSIFECTFGNIQWFDYEEKKQFALHGARCRIASNK